MSRTLLLAMLLAAVAAGDAIAETYALRFRVKKDQVSVRKEKMTYLLKGKTDEGPVEFAREGVTEYQEKVIEVKDGKRARIERKYLKYFETQSAGEREKTVDHALQGKTVVLEFKKGKPIIKSPDSVHADDVASEKFHDPFSRLMREAAVSVGDKWDLDGDDVRQVVGVGKADYKKGSGKAHFEEIVTHNGVKNVAKIALTLTLSWAVAKFNLKMNTTIKGHLYIDLSRRQPIEGKFKGPVSMAEGRLKFSGTLALTFKTTFK